MGRGEFVNELARAGLAPREHPARRLTQRTATVGLRIDVTDVAGTLELLDESDAEDHGCVDANVLLYAGDEASQGGTTRALPTQQPGP